MSILRAFLTPLSLARELFRGALDPKGPEPMAGTPTTEATNNIGGIYNNMGVPGAKIFHLGAPGYGDPTALNAGTANPYFTRFASSTTTTVIADAAAQVPTFFTLWIGNNDVLSYATAGGDGEDQTGNTDPSTYGSNDITDPDVFANLYTQFISAITTANGDAKGVLLNIPDIKVLPYFTTVPYNPIVFTADDQATIDALNDRFAAYNAGVAQALGSNADETLKRTISFSVGQNPVVIMDETLTDLTGENPALISMRQATAEDLLVLKSSSIINTAAPDDSSKLLGITSPLKDKYVLLPSEAEEIQTATAAFNTTIKAVAEANPNFLFLDVAAIMNELSTTGINFGTGTITSVYASGGGFSLDGVHPTARGYSVLANRTIGKINTGFGANIPPVNPADYPTISIK